MGSGKKKVTVIGLSSILLVAMVVAVAIGVSKKSGGGGGGSGSSEISTSNKAIKALCETTDYQTTCVDSLSAAQNTTDPKELIKVAFQGAVKNITDVISNSETIQEAAKDPRTSGALKNCKELLNTSIDDLERSFEKLASFDVSKMDEYVADLRTWLSGSITYQETCLDGFENTTGDAGEKMKKLLNASSELSSNGLAMVSQISSILSTLQIPGFNRRLMSEESSEDSEFPPWVDSKTRHLLQAAPNAVKPNAVVAQDGSGTFKSISDAINSVPKKNNQTFVILVKPGVYKEYVDIPRRVNNIVLLGSGPTKTTITGNKNFIDGIGTYKTATVAVNGDRFIAKDIRFENSAGANKHQAVALRVSGDMAVIYNCQIDAFQDTLYAHSYRQFYRDCTISGTVDFIFGDAAAVFQNCKMVVRKPMDNQACMVTAQGRKDHRGTGGLVLQNCTITAEPAFMAAKPPIMSYLGRPWKEFARTIIMQSFIDSNIAPEGWSPWAGTFALDTCYYAEYGNRGPGSGLAKRVTWKCIKKISPQEAESYTPGKFIEGDPWVRATGIPYVTGMLKV